MESSLKLPNESRSSLKNEGGAREFPQAPESPVVYGFAHGPERISEADRTEDVEFAGNHRRNSSPHGFAPYGDGDAGGYQIDDLSPALEQDRKAIGEGGAHPHFFCGTYRETRIG